MADALLGGIIINEVLPDPNSAVSASGPRFDTDNSGTTTALDEFIEIKNTSASAINIGGLQLWDQSVGKYFTFPTGTILQPGAVAMVMTGSKLGSGPVAGPNDLTFYAGRGSAVLNNGAETTILYDPTHAEFVQIAYGGGSIVTPTGVSGNFPGFPSGTSRVGAGEDFGSYIPGESIQRSTTHPDTFVNNKTPTPANSNVCFVGGSLIATPDGERCIEDLRQGDLVLTANGESLPILWAGHRHIGAAELAADARLWPIRFLPGSLGGGFPKRALRLSRQHRLRLGGKLIARMTGQDGVLIPAIGLLDLRGVDTIAPQEGVTYYHILLPKHAIVLCEGMPVESLYLGTQARQSLPQASLDEIRLILPEALCCAALPVAAHVMLSAARGRQLVKRAAKNGRALAA